MQNFQVVCHVQNNKKRLSCVTQLSDILFCLFYFCSCMFCFIQQYTSKIYAGKFLAWSMFMTLKFFYWISLVQNSCSIQRWYAGFLKIETVQDDIHAVRKSSWSSYVVEDVEKAVRAHPTFCIEELQQHLRTRFPSLRNAFECTIFRALNFNLQLSRESSQKLWEKLY